MSAVPYGTASMCPPFFIPPGLIAAHCDVRGHRQHGLQEHHGAGCSSVCFAEFLDSIGDHVEVESCVECWGMQAEGWELDRDQWLYMYSTSRFCLLHASI